MKDNEIKTLASLALVDKFTWKPKRVYSTCENINQDGYDAVLKGVAFAFFVFVYKVVRKKVK